MGSVCLFILQGHRGETCLAVGASLVHWKYLGESNFYCSGSFPNSGLSTATLRAHCFNSPEVFHLFLDCGLTTCLTLWSSQEQCHTFESLVRSLVKAMPFDTWFFLCLIHVIHPQNTLGTQHCYDRRNIVGDKRPKNFIVDPRPDLIPS